MTDYDKDEREEIGTCYICNAPIYAYPDGYEGDAYIEIDEGYCHFDDCWYEYGNRRKKHAERYVPEFDNWREEW